MDELSTKVALCFREQGYERGDEVALLMENCPDYICLWLGLAKIGVITALINTNQKTGCLAHSMNIINMKGLIFGQSFAEIVEKAMPYIMRNDTASFYSYARKGEKLQILPFSCKSLNISINNILVNPLNPIMFKTNFKDKLVYLYTSGTTGLPKAAVIRHSRCIVLIGGGNYIGQCNGPQIIYNTLPLYHVAGGFFYLGVVLTFGGKMVLRKKFSASAFWKEVVKHKVTVFQYIGEICRYLLNQPITPEETQHSVEMMIGNGLKPHIWKEFQDRFKIKRIIEVYGATEGNANLVNLFGKMGAVGFISRICTRVYPVYPIKINLETGEVIRDEKGLCVRCKPGEPGELVGKVQFNHPIHSFDGYVNSADTKKKMIRDCFQKGDVVFSSGDIMEMDEDGFLYFKDRTGDTYRWKGENISSTEVENIISKVLNFATCIVYGVPIPGTEGCAGMAAIQIDLKNINFEKLYADFSEQLPSYAVPIFIRISSDIESTGTYKLLKVNFRNQGYNPETIADPLYMLDVKKNTYICLTKQIYSKVMNGEMKL